MNYPEGWSLLAYGDQGDALRIEAGVLGVGKSRSAQDGDQKSARVGTDGSEQTAMVGGGMKSNQLFDWREQYVH